MPGRESLPSTLRRSPKKAQDTWVKAHDSAIEQYGEGQRAQRVAWSALKHGFEKVGDHWQPKAGGAKGPSDRQSAMPRGRSSHSHGGVDANASKAHLMDIARKLDVKGRSTMTKHQLVEAIEKANDRETARSRNR